MTPETRAAARAMEAAATVRPMGSRYVAMRDLAVLDATGERVEVKRGELVSAAFLNAPRVNISKLLGVRHIRQELVEV